MKEVINLIIKSVYYSLLLSLVQLCPSCWCHQCISAGEVKGQLFAHENSKNWLSECNQTARISLKFTALKYQQTETRQRLHGQLLWRVQEKKKTIWVFDIFVAQIIAGEYGHPWDRCLWQAAEEEYGTVYSFTLVCFCLYLLHTPQISS